MLVEESKSENYKNNQTCQPVSKQNPEMEWFWMRSSVILMSDC